MSSPPAVYLFVSSSSSSSSKMSVPLTYQDNPGQGQLRLFGHR
uniref:Uncharacterized protein n=1 Tax=Anguilla anguilla TaxID=7936 RepID=A0A0E9TD27_ANGAN